jgi:very-short-patch-repair endonuclease
MIYMDFDELHKEFINTHLSKRNGERKGRLLRGHNHAEKLLLQNVWMPLFGSLENLHPEFEVYDWNRKSQFLDFAFLPPFGRFGIECDGFQSHVRDMDREGFSYALNRDTFLTGMGWRMIHFSFDDVQNRPEVCRMLLQLVIGPYLMRNRPASPVLSEERDVLRLAWKLGKPIRPMDVSNYFKVNYRTARKWLRSLVEKAYLSPITRGGDVRYYELKEVPLEQLL